MTLRLQTVALVVAASILLLAALHVMRGIMAPVACALVVIALVAPLQDWLERQLPRPLAILITLMTTLLTLLALGLLVGWGFSSVGQWVVANAQRLQTLYADQMAWLDSVGLGVEGLAVTQLDFGRVLRNAQHVTGALRDVLSFTGLTLLFALLGLLELDGWRARLAAPPAGGMREALLRAATLTARKLQTYMLVRTAMSLLTGIGIGIFAHLSGLALALEWGVIAFVLNYIPFVGPLAATILPTALAGLQFGSWDMPLAVFVGMNAIQLAIGSYLEPRMTGAVLAVSAFAVLFAVFFWMLIWGIAGAFLGTPILIALLTACAQDPRSRWISDLLSSQPDPPRAAP
jgi:predicted PurR-regulated permease PerM